MTVKYAPEWVEPGNYMSSQEILEGILEGVDYTDPPEGTALSSAQVWGRLVRMTVEERTKFLDMVRSASAAGQRCLLHDHDGMVDHYGMAMAAASVQQEEAETYYKRMRRALELAHYWRQAARDFSRSKPS